MKFLLIFFLCLPARAQSPAPSEKVIKLSHFESCGLITKISPNKIPPECFQELNNIQLDEDQTLKRRNGYAVYNSTALPNGGPVKGLWPFYGVDGNNYLIAFSSGAMYYSLGDGKWTAISGLSNLSLNQEMNCVQSMGYLWCTDGLDPIFYTNAISTSNFLPNTGPLGNQNPNGATLIGAFRNRIIAAGVPGQPSTVFMSGELNGTDWYPAVYPIFSTSAVQLQISGGNDGQAITCLMGQFQNNFYVGRPYDLWGISGYSTQDFAVRQVSNEIGCSQAKSPQEVNNVLYWLSNRGVEGLSGTQINWVSYPVNDQVQQIVQGIQRHNSYSQPLQFPFSDGNLTVGGSGFPLADNVLFNWLSPDQAQFADTFQTYSNANTSTGVVVSSGSVSLLSENFNNTSPICGFIHSGENCPVSMFGNLSFSSSTASNQCFTNTGISALISLYYSNLEPTSCETSDALGILNSAQCPTMGDGATPSQCTQEMEVAQNVGYVTVFASVTLHDDYGDSYTIPINKGTLGSTGTLIAGCLSPVVISSAQYAGLITGSSFTLQFNINSVAITGNVHAPGPQKTLSYEQPFPVGSSLSFDCVSYSSNSYKSPVFYSGQVFGFGPITVNNAIMVTSGAFVSSNFNTGFQTPYYSPLSYTGVTDSSDSLTFYYSTYTAGGSGGNWTPISYLGPASNQILAYEAVLYSSSPWDTPVLNSAYISAIDTGTYITPCINTKNASQYLNFVPYVDNNGGSWNFFLQSSSTCSGATNPAGTWTAQAPNAVIAVGTNTFLAGKAVVSVTNGGEIPDVESMNFSWETGIGEPPITSSFYHDRYWLFYTTATSGGYNNQALIYNEQQKWEHQDDIYAYSSALYNNQLYVGDSNNTGTVYLLDSGSSDNAVGGSTTSFSMSFQTADLDGGDPVVPKVFSRVYFMIQAPSPTTMTSDFNCSYNLNGSTVSYSLGTIALTESPEGSGYFVAKAPFPTGQSSRGNWINLSCSYYGNQGPVRLYSIDLVYREENWQ